MEQDEKLLKDYTDSEKGAYLSAIASIATADRTASEEELEFLEALADAAELSPEQKVNIREAAQDTSGRDLKTHLNVLKGSELRFSLLTDLVAFAESDQEYSPEERANVEKIAWYLDISPEQFSTINQFVQKAATTEVSEEQVQQQGFFGALGMDDKFKKAGLNMGSIAKGLLGIAGPMILASLVSRGLGNRGGGLLGGMLGGSGGGGLGGMLGGAGGGLGGMLGGGGGLGGMLGGGGGLGSIIGMLNGGRGIRSTGGLLGRMFGGQ
jgi:uncharacterized tellurite resistance protein B-like protein